MYEPFTEEQFRLQAMELRAASARIRQLETEKIKFLNPYDPFENETEFHTYNRNYAAVLPDISQPDYCIPLRPGKKERKQIRKSYHLVGYGLITHILLSTLLAVVMILAYSVVQQLVDTAAAGGTLPENYDELLDLYMDHSSFYTVLNLLVYMICNMAIAVFGCRIAHIPIPSLFQTKDLKLSQIGIYCSIGLCLQMAAGYTAYFFTQLLSDAGITAYEADFSTGTDFKHVAVMFLYTCLIAPVTEELLFRGFALKNLSRVSQSFGIVMSAFLFGIWHENISQFLLAFLVGIFFGYLTVKHNSILPSILVHAAVNLTSELFDIFDTYGLYSLYDAWDLLSLIIVIVGAFFLIRMLLCERLPKSMPRQTERGLRLALTSIPLLLVIVYHIGMSIQLIIDETMA